MGWSFVFEELLVEPAILLENKWSRLRLHRAGEYGRSTVGVRGEFYRGVRLQQSEV